MSRCHGLRSVEDAHGRWWRGGRAHVWFPLGPARGFESDAGWRGDVGFEYVHGKTSYGRLRLKVSTTGEETLDVAYGLGPLLQHYWSFVVQRPGGTGACYALKKAAAEHGPDCRRCGGTGLTTRSRQVRLPRLRFEAAVGLTGASWCLGQDDGHWRTDAPLKERLRRNHLRWFRLGWHGGAEKPAVVDKTISAVYLPEGAYPVTVTLKRRRWRVLVGPYRPSRRSKCQVRFYLPVLRRVSYSAEIDAAADGAKGLPIPGKGENSWDCGQDALMATSVKVAKPDDVRDREWLAPAIAKATESVLRSRLRYGSGIGDTGA